jgi:hypothetical protein
MKGMEREFSMKKKREGNREATGEVFFSIRFPVSLFFLLGVGKESC